MFMSKYAIFLNKECNIFAVCNVGHWNMFTFAVLSYRCYNSLIFMSKYAVSLTKECNIFVVFQGWIYNSNRKSLKLL
jgi:hypothetical protein